MQRFKFALFECLGFVWALPITLLGVLAIIGAGGWRKVARLSDALPWQACLIFELRNPWYWPARYAGLDLGAVIIVRRLSGDLGRLLSHELVHKRQCWALGPFTLLAYPLASLCAWVRHGEPYRMNWFECQARQNETDVSYDELG